MIRNTGVSIQGPFCLKGSHVLMKSASDHLIVIERCLCSHQPDSVSRCDHFIFHCSI